jgi:hypothetical protein
MNSNADTKKKRGPRIELRLSAEDDQTIRHKAELAGLSVSEYMRRTALGLPVQARIAAADLDNLRKIGINLNQVVKWAHTHQQWPDEIETLILRLKTLLTDVH